jgi:hypothetical protein
MSFISAYFRTRPKVQEEIFNNLNRWQSGHVRTTFLTRKDFRDEKVVIQIKRAIHTHETRQYRRKYRKLKYIFRVKGTRNVYLCSKQNKHIWMTLGIWSTVMLEMPPQLYAMHAPRSSSNCKLTDTRSITAIQITSVCVLREILENKVRKYASVICVLTYTYRIIVLGLLLVSQCCYMKMLLTFLNVV